MVALECDVVDRPAIDEVRPLRVGVLVDLELGPRAGGHVKCWERLAQAARQFGRTLDLSVHFTGSRSEVVTLSENVRYVIEPPVFSTARLPFLSHVPDHTDLAPFHPGLARRLPRYDVIHTTDAYFAYARTAMRHARRTGVPLVSSVHTNTPGYGRIYTALTIERVLGRGVLSRLLIQRLALCRVVEQRMLGQLAAHQRNCAFSLVSRPEQLAALRGALGARAGLLRRGVDRACFSPVKRDRNWLDAAYGVPAGRPVVLFVGRVNGGKNVPMLIEALTNLTDRGVEFHLVCAGAGDLRGAVAARLGDRASCPGVVPPDLLAKLYASADLFVLPSAIEESANVVPEALASGLPALVARESGMSRLLVEAETGMALPGHEPAAWTDAIGALLRDPARLGRMGQAARRYAELRLPSWEDVLAEDLLPRWRAAHAGRPILRPTT